MQEIMFNINVEYFLEMPISSTWSPPQHYYGHVGKINQHTSADLTLATWGPDLGPFFD